MTCSYCHDQRSIEYFDTPIDQHGNPCGPGQFVREPCPKCFVKQNVDLKALDNALRKIGRQKQWKNLKHKQN